MSFLDQYAKELDEAVWPLCPGCGARVKPGVEPPMFALGKEWIRWAIPVVQHPEPCGLSFEFSGFMLRILDGKTLISGYSAQIVQIHPSPYLSTSTDKEQLEKQWNQAEVKVEARERELRRLKKQQDHIADNLRIENRKLKAENRELKAQCRKLKAEKEEVLARLEEFEERLKSLVQANEFVVNNTKLWEQELTNLLPLDPECVRCHDVEQAINHILGKGDK